MTALDVPWCVQALPTIVPITAAAAAIDNPELHLPSALLPTLQMHEGSYSLVNVEPAIRLFACSGGIFPPAVLLPLDRLFDVRCSAALQFWRLASGKSHGRGPKPLTTQHRQRLMLALRALDARQQHASYREIAKGLFHIDDMTTRNWETHDARDRTIRLVRLGTTLMEGGYRQLLLYPYRAKL